MLKMTLLNKFRMRMTKLIIKNYSNIAQAVNVQEDTVDSFRTKENNPVNHNIQHLSKFYTIPSKDIKILFAQGLPTEYQKQIKTFAEMCILIRKPAIELINCLTRTDYTKSVNRYVIYGEPGCGKTSTLLHVLHYGYKTKKILVHVHWAQNWFRFPKEVADSTTKEGFVDLPIDAATWLLNFKNQNFSLLTQADIRLSKTYEWSLSEISQKDSSLIELIDLGINRIKYACDIIIALMSELKQASIEGKCKVLVAIDGFNAFYSDSTQIKNDVKQIVPASKVSLTHAFLDISKSNWCNGQVVVTVDKQATKDRRESHLPRYLLTAEGFDLLDPFLPIAVENYSQEEFDTVIEYYKNRKWIRNITFEGQKELKLLSDSNPYKLINYCKHL